MEILGIDVGGSGIKGALVNIETGKLLEERHRIPTPQPATPKAVAKTIAKLTQHFNWHGPIGCGFPAAIQNGIARTASNVDKKWIGTNVEVMFTKATGCPVKVINDADAAGLAVAHFGVGKGKKGVLMLLTVGTGIGSALLVNGHLVPNTELGHLKFKGGIAEHYAADSIRKQKDLSWDEWAKRFNQYLNHLYRLFYPDLFIIGGGVSKKFSTFEKHFDVPTKVVAAKLQNTAGIVGAALSVRETLVDIG